MLHRICASKTRYVSLRKENKLARNRAIRHQFVPRRKLLTRPEQACGRSPRRNPSICPRIAEKRTKIAHSFSIIFFFKFFSDSPWAGSFHTDKFANIRRVQRCSRLTISFLFASPRANYICRYFIPNCRLDRRPDLPVHLLTDSQDMRLISTVIHRKE